MAAPSYARRTLPIGDTGRPRRSAHGRRLPTAEALNTKACYTDTRTTDESPERVAIVQHATVDWLRTALDMDHSAWPRERQRLAAAEYPATIDSKQMR